MTRTALALALVLATSLSCAHLAAIGGQGLDSASCDRYFDMVLTCASKADDHATPESRGLAQQWRDAAQTHRERFERSVDPWAVEASCEALAPPLAQHPFCQR